MDIPSRRTPDGPVVAHDDDDASSHAELPLVRRERTEGKEPKLLSSSRASVSNWACARNCSRVCSQFAVVR